jgi:ribosomal-protein-alanine N-acetyltransferase
MTARPRVETPRLLLVAWPLELLDDARPFGAELPPDWPDEERQGLLDLYRGWLGDDPAVLGFGPWIAVAREANRVVGSAGFVGRPRGGEVELGFGIAPESRGRGYATEAARALVEWALAQEGVERVVARCDADNAPSIRVLEKVGFTRAGSDGAVLSWTLP